MHNIELIKTIPLEGHILEGKDVSGISFNHKHILIGSDEGSSVQVLQGDENLYKVINHQIDLFPSVPDNDAEIDIESITADNEGHYYVLGSHSTKRKKIKEKKSYKENRERIQIVSQDPLRCNLFRLKLDDTGTALLAKDSINLNPVFEQDPVLKTFYNIPCKENGIDLEGIAFYQNKLYLGFRGPVLRQNFVPVLVISFEKPEEYEMRFIKLDGRGIRDLERVEDGFLVISGPVSTGDKRFYLHFWKGMDEIPGADKDVEENQVLGEIVPPVEGAKAEGITLMEETNEFYKVIILYDGAQMNQLRLYKVKKQLL